MKKLLLVVGALLLIVNAQAQEDKKSPTMWLGGEVTFGTLSALDYTLGPSFGIMIGESIAVGGTIIYSGSDTENSYSIEPYFRYYLPITDNFSFYGDGFIGYGGGDTDTTDDTKGDYTRTNIGARAGLQYWFTPNWSLAASTNVLEYVARNDKDNEFGIGASFNTVNFSFFYHF